VRATSAHDISPEPEGIATLWSNTLEKCESETEGNGNKKHRVSIHCDKVIEQTRAAC